MPVTNFVHEASQNTLSASMGVELARPRWPAACCVRHEPDLSMAQKTRPGRPVLEVAASRWDWIVCVVCADSLVIVVELVVLV